MISESHADVLSDVLNLIRSRLIDGAYDLLNNHHQDVIEIDSGQHHYVHPLTQSEAEAIERAVWSAGEDETITALLRNIERGLLAAGFNLVGVHLDVTIRLREIAAVTEVGQ